MWFGYVVTQSTNIREVFSFRVLVVGSVSSVIEKLVRKSVPPSCACFHDIKVKRFFPHTDTFVIFWQDTGPISLLDRCGPIFEELEDHQVCFVTDFTGSHMESLSLTEFLAMLAQVSLQSMLCGSAAGSFSDDIMKWQKRLQTIEAVLTVWLEVQEKWIELEDVSKRGILNRLWLFVQIIVPTLFIY